jgi:tetratricopeptide (TPR) repeat protein
LLITGPAIECHEQALAISREITDRRGLLADLCNLGNACATSGQHRRAIECYEEAVMTAREIDDPHGEANTLFNLSLEIYEAGERERAITLAGEALKIYHQIEDRNAALAAAQLNEWRQKEAEEQASDPEPLR